jgi:hypothetical protein
MKWIELCERRTEAESMYHSVLTPARETRWAMHMDLLMVMFAMVIVDRCSVVRGERQGGDESVVGVTCRQRVREGRVGASDCGCLLR